MLNNVGSDNMDNIVFFCKIRDIKKSKYVRASIENENIS